MTFDINKFIDHLENDENQATEYLKKLSDTTLSFDGKKLSDLAVRTLANILKSNTKVTEVSFWGCHLGDENVQIIVKALNDNKTITSLTLCSNDITDDSSNSIGIMIRKNSTLKELNLSYNRLSDKGMQKISHMMEHNKSIENLYMSTNEVKNGVHRLADAMKDRDTSLNVDLFANKVNDAGLKAISETLNKNNSPKSIQLGCNRDITDVGVNLLTAKLEKTGEEADIHVSPHIVGANVITPAAVKRLDRQVQENGGRQ